MKKKTIPRTKRAVNFYPWWDNLFNSPISIYTVSIPGLCYSSDYVLLALAAAGNNESIAVSCWRLLQDRLEGKSDD